MSWFQNLTSALSSGGSSNTPAPGTQSFGADGAPIQTNEVAPAPAPAGNQGTSNTTSAPASASIEDLLFSPAQEPNNSAPAPAATPAPNNQAPGDVELAPGLTSKQLIGNLQSVNFLGTIPKETLTAALGGDETAFSQVISNVAQLSAAIAVQQSLTANKAALDKRFADLDGTLNSKIGESKYADVLNDPKFSNPFVKPLAENLVGRLRARDASITPDQIKQVLPSLIEHAMKQMSQNNSSPASQPNKQSGTSKPTEVNIDELFS